MPIAPPHRDWHRKAEAPVDTQERGHGVGRGGRRPDYGACAITNADFVPLAGDESSELIRHFLIESSARGVHLKGASEELYFGKDGATAAPQPRELVPKAPRSTGRHRGCSVAPQ